MPCMILRYTVLLSWVKHPATNFRGYVTFITGLKYQYLPLLGF